MVWWIYLPSTIVICGVVIFVAYTGHQKRKRKFMNEIKRIEQEFEKGNMLMPKDMTDLRDGDKLRELNPNIMHKNYGNQQ